MAKLNLKLNVNKLNAMDEGDASLEIAEKVVKAMMEQPEYLLSYVNEHSNTEEQFTCASINIFQSLLESGIKFKISYAYLAARHVWINCIDDLLQKEEKGVH